MSKPLPQIFLSYAWADTDAADVIDNDFKAVGINFIRDVRDLGYRQSIKEFMNRIGKSDYVFMIISDEYLRSLNCMYEVMELLNTHELEKRIIPIRMENANKAFDRKGRATYYDFWKAEIDLAKTAKLKHYNDDTHEQYKRCCKIYDGIGDFLNKLIDLNILPFETLKENNYRPILNLLNIEDKGILEAAIGINNIKDSEDKDVAIEEFLEKHPNNQHGLFLKAIAAYDKNEYKKSKKYYINLISKHPNFSVAYNNLAIILKEYINDYDGAKTNYLIAIKLNPNYETAHYNFASLLLSDYFKDYNGAKMHYLQAIAINANHDMAHNNLAILLKVNFQDFEGAKNHYNKAISINPNNDSSHYNLAILLSHDFFKDYEAAKLHYQKAILINPNYDMAYLGLANLLVYAMNDIEGGKIHYIKATELNASLIEPELDKLFGIDRG